ncbi:MAG: alcohol dehydrogenase catalytic domain-containing protein, partial [Sciscionella sp.]
PYVPGIEAAGRVRALGEGVDSVQVGQRAVAA